MVSGTADLMQVRCIVRKARATFLSATAVVAAFALSPVIAGATAASATHLVGTFRIAAGASAGSGAKGSYFRMLQPNGKLGSGPYLANASSTATNKTYTLFKPGTDGGLVTGKYQPAPAAAFDSKGNALAKRIVLPLAFFNAKFSVSTQPKDPQTAKAVPAPSISYDGAGHLTGDLRAFGAWWNKGKFNQGAPKPDGTKPGLTAGPTGTYNTKTRTFTLDWTSQIVGGPFNGFTGQWHLQGTFVPSA